MPVFCRQAEHHYAKHNEEIAEEEHASEIAKIEERPRQYPNEDEQPALDGSDPTDR
jgi:hypothetical protein